MGVEPGLSVQPEAGTLSPPPPSGPCSLPRAEEGGALGAEPAASSSCQVQPCRVQLIWVSAGASSTSFLPRPEPPGESRVPWGPQDKTSIRPSCRGLPTLAWVIEPQMYAGGMARGPPIPPHHCPLPCGAWDPARLESPAGLVWAVTSETGSASPTPIVLPLGPRPAPKSRLSPLHASQRGNGGIRQGLWEAWVCPRSWGKWSFLPSPLGRGGN